MSRTRTLQIAALNIAMHKPHSPQRYIDLLKEIHARQDRVHFGELHFAILGDVRPLNKDAPLEGLTGEFFRSLEIDPSDPWFNTKTAEAATDEEVSEIKIPAHLLPHLKRIPFFFHPGTHELWYVRKDRKDALSPAMATKLFEGLVAPLVADGKFPPVEVTSIPDKDVLSKMLAIPTLEKLFIELKRPNTDGGVSEERDWQDTMARQNAKRLQVELTAASSESIKPDDDTRSLARAASRNGKVEVRGRDRAGKKVFKSTAQHPMVEAVPFDPNIETVSDVLQRMAAESEAGAK